MIVFIPTNDLGAPSAAAGKGVWYNGQTWQDGDAWTEANLTNAVIAALNQCTWLRHRIAFPLADGHMVGPIVIDGDLTVSEDLSVVGDLAADEIEANSVGATDIIGVDAVFNTLSVFSTTSLHGTTWTNGSTLAGNVTRTGNTRRVVSNAWDGGRLPAVLTNADLSIDATDYDVVEVPALTASHVWTLNDPSDVSCRHRLRIYWKLPAGSGNTLTIKNSDASTAGTFGDTTGEPNKIFRFIDFDWNGSKWLATGWGMVITADGVPNLATA